MSEVTYRVMGIKRLSKNVYYPVCLGNYPFTVSNEAIRHANNCANAIAKNNENYDTILINDGSAESDCENNFISHIKVTDSSRSEDIIDIFVYPFEQDGPGLSPVYRYRGMDIKCNNTDECLDIYASCFKFGSTASLDGALMFIDTFLFVCDLQQKDK